MAAARSNRKFLHQREPFGQAIFRSEPCGENFPADFRAQCAQGPATPGNHGIGDHAERLRSDSSRSPRLTTMDRRHPACITGRRLPACSPGLGLWPAHLSYFVDASVLPSKKIRVEINDRINFRLDFKQEPLMAPGLLHSSWVLGGFRFERACKTGSFRIPGALSVCPIIFANSKLPDLCGSISQLWWR